MDQLERSLLTSSSHTIETRSGKLVNKRLCVYYPSSPPRGCNSSLTEQVKLMKARKKVALACFSVDSDVIHHFLGATSLSKLSQDLQAEEICLFYLLKNKDSLSPEVRLHLGYKDETNQIFVYPLSKRAGEWSIDEDDTGASFESLENLVSHYKIFRFIDIGTGKLSLMPTKRAIDAETVFENIQKL